MTPNSGSKRVSRPTGRRQRRLVDAVKDGERAPGRDILASLAIASAAAPTWRRLVRLGAGCLVGAVALAGCASSPPAVRQVVDLEVIGTAVVGDWRARDDVAGEPFFLRLEPEGGLLQGSWASFGSVPGVWRARRLHLIRRESLLVTGTDDVTACAYYVRLIERVGAPVEMHWRADDSGVDLSPYEGRLARALAPAGPCPARVWDRMPSPATPASPAAHTPPASPAADTPPA